MKNIFFGLVAFIFVFATSGCVAESTANREQAVQTEQLAQESNRQVGMPGITNFTEKRLLRQLYELRDQEIKTYTYVVDMQGRLFHVCDSIGFGMPFSAQYSNPEVRGDWREMPNMPQPEPNGLFPPTSSSATWVICSDPTGGDFRPVYVEPLIMVSTFPLKGIVASYAGQ